MIIIKFGTWSGASLTFFNYRRFYIRGRWTPFCRVNYRRTSLNWSFLERVRFVVECWFADIERKIRIRRQKSKTHGNHNPYNRKVCRQNLL